MATARHDGESAKLAFWATGLSVFVLWNVATVIGAVGAQGLTDPRSLGLDAAVPAAFIALLAPRLRGLGPWSVAFAAGGLALLLSPVLPAGLPVLAAALVAVAAGLRPFRRVEAS